MYTQTNLYLDEQPTIHSIIETFMDSLEPSFTDGFSCDLETIECRRRDGFIPHGHNKGGFDKTFFTDLMMLWGSGQSIGKYDQSMAQDILDEFYPDFFNGNSDFEDIPEDKRDYHSLHELGLSKLAEKLSDAETEYLSEFTIYYGYRAMYEGSDADGIHTLSIYAGVNMSDYYGPMGKGSDTLAEYHIEFSSAFDLRSKLEEIKTELENLF